MLGGGVGAAGACRSRQSRPCRARSWLGAGWQPVVGGRLAAAVCRPGDGARPLQMPSLPAATGLQPASLGGSVPGQAASSQVARTAGQAVGFSSRAVALPAQRIAAQAWRPLQDGGLRLPTCCLACIAWAACWRGAMPSAAARMQTQQGRRWAAHVPPASGHPHTGVLCGTGVTPQLPSTFWRLACAWLERRPAGGGLLVQPVPSDATRHSQGHAGKRM